LYLWWLSLKQQDEGAAYVYRKGADGQYAFYQRLVATTVVVNAGFGTRLFFVSSFDIIKALRWWYGWKERRQEEEKRGAGWGVWGRVREGRGGEGRGGETLPLTASRDLTPLRPYSFIFCLYINTGELVAFSRDGDTLAIAMPYVNGGNGAIEVFRRTPAGAADGTFVSAAVLAPLDTQLFQEWATTLLFSYPFFFSFVGIRIL
jgi:hypothetical protein